MKFLLDTSSIIWAVSNPNQLSERGRKILSNPESEIQVSPMSCAEIACAVERGRLQLDRHWKIWFRHFVDVNGWDVVPIDLPVIEEAYSLPEPFHRDPSDRILVATSRLYRSTLLTSDQKILNYPHVDSVW
ncbi:MAG: type II toxin-antitoxin system VapC family toxin [Deltaproteobacteria bacterium]|nr:type II toxin-antitoxin system VapC family toxin [Deltaproteobacteria bacterium]